MTTTPDRYRYALATHTVMKLMEEGKMRLEEAIWEAVRDHRLGLCEYGRLVEDAKRHYPKQISNA
jgi:hypothetical protein